MHQVLKKLKERHYYVILKNGTCTVKVDIGNFRALVKKQSPLLQAYLRHPQLGAAGWMTKEEFRKQQTFLQRAWREKPDSIVELEALMGFSTRPKWVREWEKLNLEEIPDAVYRELNTLYEPRYRVSFYMPEPLRQYVMRK